MRRFKWNRVFLLSAAGFAGIPHAALAAAFQLWEQDGASIGNYHAGRAATAEDASTAYYNPAGLVRIKNQQVVFGLVPVVTDIKFRGTVNLVNTGTPGVTLQTGNQPAVVQGGTFNLIPDLHYAAPISDRIVFGFSIAAPFGLATDYGTGTIAQYAATRTAFEMVDISPSLGVALTEKLSLGAGFDAEHATGEFDTIAGMVMGDGQIPENMNTTSKNTGKSWGYGYHLGALYQFSEKTRAGLGYQSQIRQHLKGSSKFGGPLASNNVFQSNNDFNTDMTLPPTTTVSLFHSLNTVWDVMGTLSYTQWNVTGPVILKNVSGMLNADNIDDLTVVVPQKFRNTWNASVGTNYHVNEEWMLRTGFGFDQTPTRNAYRNLQLPDSDRLALAFGTHYQMTSTLAVDLGWTHIFAMNTRIYNHEQTVGDQQTITNGSVQASADVFGMQVKWDIV